MNSGILPCSEVQYIHWMREAMEQARLAQKAGEVPVGAVVVQGHQIIAAAHNRTRELGDATAHAEVLALREASLHLGRWRLYDCRLIVTMEPCPLCAGAAVLSRVGEIVFGAFDAAMGCCGSVYNLPGGGRLAGVPSPQILGGILEEECAQLLQSFFQSRRKEDDR